MPITAKSSPSMERTRSKGESPWVFTNWRNMLSGLRKMSRGPRKPRMERRMQRSANSVLMAAEAPLESESCLPARIARHGIAWATNMPMADSICSAVAPSMAPWTAALAMAPCTTWSIL